MSADGDIVREALIPGTSLTVGDQVLAALARLEAAEAASKEHENAAKEFCAAADKAEAQRDALAKALRGIAEVHYAGTYRDGTSTGADAVAELQQIARAALAEAGLE